jgi:thiol:disulfide interchange protein DsbC
MKSLSKLSALLLALSFNAGHALADADEKRLDEVRQKISAQFDEIQPEHVVPSPIEGWYTIRKGAIIAYVSADGRYLLQGDLIDLDNQSNLSEVARNDARRDMMAAVPDSDVIVFSPEKIRHTVNIFTDVDCTYCRRLHSQIDEYLAQGIEVRYLLYPRNGPASASWATAERVWCSDKRNEALTLAKLGKDFDSRNCGSPMIGKHYAMGQDVGLRGTPAIVLQDGTLVSGYLSPGQLAEVLASSDEVNLTQRTARQN